jgi:hypothetical protein
MAYAKGSWNIGREALGIMLGDNALSLSCQFIFAASVMNQQRDRWQCNKANQHTEYATAPAKPMVDEQLTLSLLG